MVGVMELDRHGLEILSREECLRLVRASRVGRLVVTDRALPAAFPVSYAVLDEDIVVLASCAGRLTGTAGEEVVAFEVDEIDPTSHTGWSVLIQGLAAPIEDPVTRDRAAGLGLLPWAPTGDFRFVLIRAELVSGRRLLTWAVPEVRTVAVA